MTYNNDLATFVATKKWDWFLTLTTSYELSYKSARRLTNRYFGNIHKLSPNSRFEMFYTIEPHKIKGGTHIHALLNSEYDKRINDKIMFDFLVKQFQRTAGKTKTGLWQRNKISKIKGDTTAVSKYCAKYITKETQLYWDILLTGHTDLIN